MLSTSALNKPGQQFTVEASASRKVIHYQKKELHSSLHVQARLTAALKCFDFYVGLVGHHGLGTFDGERFLAISAGLPCSINHKYNTENGGSQTSSDMPSISPHHRLIDIGAAWFSMQCFFIVNSPGTYGW